MAKTCYAVSLLSLQGTLSPLMEDSLQLRLELGRVQGAVRCAYRKIGSSRAETFRTAPS